MISRKNPSSVAKSALSLCNWVNSSRKATAVYFWVSIISSLSVKRPRKRGVRRGELGHFLLHGYILLYLGLGDGNAPKQPQNGCDQTGNHR